MRRGLALTACAVVLACPLLVFASGPAQAGGIIHVIDMEQLLPGSVGGGTATEAAGYSLAEDGALVAAPELTVPLLVASAAAFGLSKLPDRYGSGTISNWLSYTHPRSSGAAAPPSNTTTYGGGSWTGGCSGTYDQVGCGQFSAAYVVTISTALQVGAVAGTGRVTVSAQDNASQYEVSASAQVRCVDGSTVNDPTSGTWDVPRYGNPGGFAGQQHTFTFDASLCGAAGGTSRFIVAGLNFLYTLGGTLAYPAGGPTTATATPSVTCSDGTTVAGAATPYDPTVAAPVRLPIPQCAGGAVPASAKIADTAVPGGAPAVTWTAPPEWSDPSASPYADCLPGGAQAPCVMLLGVLTATGLQTCGQEVDCTTYTVQDPASTATQVTEPDGNTYECWWGSYQMPLTDCDGMGQDEGTATVPDTTPTGSPELGLPPEGVSVDCMPSGWGLINPISWVKDPVECALKYEFTPSQGAMTDATTSIRNAFSGSALGSAATGAGDIVSSVTGLVSAANGGGCDGPQLPAVPSVGLSDPSYPLSACDTPMRTWAAFSRLILGFLVGLGGAMAAIQIVLKAFGMVPPWHTDTVKVWGGEGRGDAT